MTRKELALLYNVAPSTMRVWLRNIGIEPCKRRLSPKELQIIKEEFGDPEIYREFEKQAKTLGLCKA